jgi:hypothetical protein
MKRVVCLTVAAVLAVGIGLATAQQKPATAKTQSTNGVVKAVTASSLTVENGGKSMAFTVASSTHLLARGSTAKTKEVQAAGAPGLVITDMVHVGDRVTVSYSSAGTVMTAVEVRVLDNPIKK